MNEVDLIAIVLSENMKNFALYIYDPDFFAFKIDNHYIPYLSYNNPNRKNIRLITTDYVKLNRENIFDCNEDKDYDFSKCISDAMKKKIGCKMPWSSRVSKSSTL